MIQEYLQKALSKAHYEIIKDEEPYYGEIVELKGVWATGKTLEKCRQNLIEVLEGWLIIRLKNNLKIPVIDDIKIEETEEIPIT